MQLTSKQITMFLLGVEGIGAAFVIVYSAAYLLGLPSTNVLHSEPAFRTILSVLGVLLIGAALAGLIISAVWKRKD